jgi:hypothetical protein
MRDRIVRIGFQHPVRNIRRLMARRIAFTELLMTVVLVVCLAVALTAVSFGMARADTLSAIIDGHDRALAVTAFLSLLGTGIGGITAVLTRRDRQRD